MAIQEKLYTSDDLSELSQDDGKRYELIKGILPGFSVQTSKIFSVLDDQQAL